MRLITATVENYRVHQSVTVAFAGGMTLIAAANESGKSTLVEAMHRALFLPHRTGGQTQADMQACDGGHPSVTLQFAAGGNTWTLRKVFRRAQGACTLTCDRPAQQWQGDAAEERLRDLLAAAGGGDVRPLQRWDHLWVMQGSAHGDPMVTAGAGELFAALAAGGGATASLAPADLALIESLRLEVDAAWTQRGGARDGSELGRLQAQLGAAEAAVKTARDQRADRQHLVDQLVAQQAVVRSHEPEVKERRAALDVLGQQVEEAKHEARQLDPAQDKVTEATAAIAELEASVRQAEVRRAAVAKLVERERDLQVKRGLIAERAATLGREETALAADVQRAQRRQMELSNQASLAEAVSGDLRLVAEHERLMLLSQRRTASAGVLDAKRTALSALVQVAAKELKRLRALDTELGHHRAALAAVAATITWQSGPGTVVLDGKPLAHGGLQQIDVATELVVAGNHLIIRPGGGQDLVALREAAVTAERALAAGLAALGAASIEAVAALHDARRNAEQEVEAARAGYEAMEDPTTLIESAGVELARVRRQLEAQRVAGVVVPEAATPETLRLQADAAGTEAAKLVKALSAICERGQAETEAGVAADGVLAKLAAELAHARGQLAAEELRLGPAEVFAQRRAELATLLSEVTARLAGLQAALALRDPVALERRHQLLKQSLRTLENELASASGVVQQLTRQVGGGIERDLDAAVDEAQARSERLGREVAAATVRAEGIRLLYLTLCAVRDEAREREEAPFLAAVARYLGIIFPGAQVGLADDDGQRILGLINRERAGFGSFDFSALSRGTQELLAAAVRLAMAEVIASRRVDRCLPVVFDDAFANLDPERLGHLGLMLDLARQRGLQIILLSCNDRDCSALGENAKVRLERRRVTGAAATARGPDAVEDEVESAMPAPAALAMAANGAVGAPTRAIAAPSASAEADEAALLGQVSAGGGDASSRALRGVLGWEPERFNRVRDALVLRGLLIQPAGSRSLRRTTDP